MTRKRKRRVVSKRVRTEELADKSVAVRLSSDLYEQVVQEAQAVDRSVSYWIRQAIVAALKKGTGK